MYGGSQCHMLLAENWFKLNPDFLDFDLKDQRLIGALFHNRLLPEDWLDNCSLWHRGLFRLVHVYKHVSAYKKYFKKLSNCHTYLFNTTLPKYCLWIQNFISLPKSFIETVNFVFFLPEITATDLEAMAGNIFCRKDMKDAASNLFLYHIIPVNSWSP